MAQKSGFFNANKVGTTYDRIYYAEDFAEMMSNMVGDGVLDEDEEKLLVHAQDSPNLTVYITKGRAFISGYWFENTADYTMEVEPTSASAARIDAVAIRLDLANRQISIALVKGEAAETPVAPTPTRNSEVYELFVALINMPISAAQVLEEYITDTRNDASLCGKLYHQKQVSGLSDQEVDDICTY